MTKAELELLDRSKQQWNVLVNLALPSFLLVHGTESSRPASHSVAWCSARPLSSPRLALRFHDLRHTCAALLMAQGAHAKEIAQRLGHSTVRLTLDRYGHLLPSLDEWLGRRA